MKKQVQIRSLKISFVLIVLWGMFIIINCFFKDNVSRELLILINILGLNAGLLLIAPKLGIYKYAE